MQKKILTVTQTRKILSKHNIKKSKDQIDDIIEKLSILARLEYEIFNEITSNEERKNSGSIVCEGVYNRTG